MTLMALGLAILLAQGTASVQGTVVRAGGQTPVVGARVLIAALEPSAADALTTSVSLGDAPNPQNPIPVLGSLQGVFQATTNATGEFAVHGIDPGSYRIFVEHPDHVPGEYGQRAADKPGVPVILAAGQTLRLSLPIIATGAFTGRVVDQYGEPRRNFTARAMIVTYSQGRRLLKTTKEVQTNDLGEFRLYGLSPGRYCIAVIPPPVARINTNDPSFANRGSIQQPRGGTMAGDYAITAGLVPASPFIAETSFPIYFGGASEEEAAAVDLPAGAVFDTGTLVSLFAPRAHVRGSVVDGKSNAPVGGARVSAAPRGALAPVSAVADNEGNFDLAGLAPGTYVVRAAALTNLVGQLQVEVSGIGIENLRLVLQPPVNLTGKVSIEGRPPALNDPDFASLRIVLTPMSGNLVASVPVRPDGVISVPNLTAVDYSVTLAGARGSSYLKSVQLGDTDVLSSGLHLATVPEAPLQIVVSPNGGRIEGIVVDATQRPMPSATVALIPDAPRRQRFDLYRKGTTNASGRVLLDGVAPGPYRILAWEDVDENAWQNADFIRAFESRAEAIVIKEGSPAEVSLRVIPR